MTRLSYTVLAFGLTLATSTSAIAQAAADPAPPPRTHQFPKSGMEAPVANEGTVDDNAVEALNEMSNYLRSANTLALTSEATRDVVTNDGQRIQLEGVAKYKIRKPNGFVIDYTSDIKDRSFIYDGKTFTVYSPKLGFYAQAPAPATNKEVLDTIYNKFGIALPLEDLFRWGEDGDKDRVKALRSAYEVGSATVRGVETDHFAFREDNVDGEIWIQKADPPLPV